MASAKYGDEDIRRGIPEPTPDERIHRTGLDDYINFLLVHHGAREAIVPPRDVPDVKNVSGESFFYRNCWIPKNIQAPRYVNGIPDGGHSIRREGEVPVTFYNYPSDSGKFEYVVMPLQYLYENYGTAMAPEGFPFPDPPPTPHQDAMAQGGPPPPSSPGVSRKNTMELQKPLRVMEFPACYYAKDFLRAFSSEHIWNLRDRGDSLPPGVSFRLTPDSEHFTVAISIPYLGVEENVGPLARNVQELNDTHAARFTGRNAERPEILQRLKRLEELTDFRESPRPSWPRESLTLNQNRYSNDDNPHGNSVDNHFILVHRAGIILLNTSSRDKGNDKERLAIFRSCDDRNSNRVPLLSHQKSISPLDAFLNVLSNTLKSSERAVLENLRCKASNHSSDFQKLATRSGATKDIEGRLISSSATLSDELSIVIDVVKSQMHYIEDLQEFLTRLGSSADHPNGSLQIPGQWNEETISLLKKIYFILEERQAFLDMVNEIFTGVKAIEKSFYQLSTLKASQDMRSAIRRLRKETVLEMQNQGKRFRKAWWKRIIPLREKASPFPATADDW